MTRRTVDFAASRECIASHREYIAARQRGETVPEALSRARAERVVGAVLTPTDPANDAIYAYAVEGVVAAYDVNPRELARVTSDPILDALTGTVRDATTGERILRPVILPDGATVRVYVYDDSDSNPNDSECYDDATLEAWERDVWHYVGVSAVVTLWDGRRGESAVWGVEQGDYWPGSDEAQIWHVIPDQIAEALCEAQGAEPDDDNIPESDRATCGTCGRSWNATTYPTPAGRCPFEADHGEPDDLAPDEAGRAIETYQQGLITLGELVNTLAAIDDADTHQRWPHLTATTKRRVFETEG